MSDLWPALVSALAIVVPLLATSHIVLNKRDVRAAIGWVGLVWLAPVVGAVLYLVLGVNRIRREARALRGGRTRYHMPTPSAPMRVARRGALLKPPIQSLLPLAQLMNSVTPRPLEPGNAVEMLLDGDQAYPKMLRAIESAERSITLTSYIFDNDPVGLRFVEALGRARKRGVEVRVLVDAAGSRYSVPSIYGPLRRHGLRAARFLPTWLPWRVPFFNLRNHRKILVVDGRTAFAGGMNIRQRHVLRDSPKNPVSDTHFKIEGPAVRHLQEIFAEDWQFMAKEALKGTPWFSDLVDVGPVVARGIADGPDEDFEIMRYAFLGALACARNSVHIATPYFLPDAGLVSALQVTALRGVEVTIVVPERSNIPIVHWAMWPTVPALLEHGCRLFLSPAPFDHSKLLVVDETWVLFGSSNWDPRSLRLNFELGVECFDPALGAQVRTHIEGRARAGREVTLAELRRRRLPIRLRDGVARLLSPYL